MPTKTQENSKKYSRDKKLSSKILELRWKTENVTLKCTDKFWKFQFLKIFDLRIFLDFRNAKYLEKIKCVEQNIKIQ